MSALHPHDWQAVAHEARRIARYRLIRNRLFKTAEREASNVHELRALMRQMDQAADVLARMSEGVPF